MIKKCNVCNKAKPLIFFKKNKKTCRGCERTLGNYLMRMLVKSRKLTPAERMGNRLGYMGTAFIMMSPYLLPYDNIGAYTYLCGAILSLPQVWLAKQWNLVLINLNLLIGYGIFLFGQDFFFFVRILNVTEKVIPPYVVASKSLVSNEFPF